MFNKIILCIVLLSSCSKSKEIEYPPELKITKYLGVQSIRSTDLNDTNITRYEYICEVSNTVLKGRYLYNLHKSKDSSNGEYPEFFDIQKDSTLTGVTLNLFSVKGKITSDSLILEYKPLDNTYSIKFEGKKIK
jgi:hypothetical protein